MHPARELHCFPHLVRIEAMLTRALDLFKTVRFCSCQGFGGNKGDDEAHGGANNPPPKKQKTPNSG